MASHTFNLVTGKQYISMPLLPDDASPTAIFGSGVEVKGFDHTTQSWYTPILMERLNGYFIRSPDERAVTIVGTQACIVSISELVDIYNTLSDGDFALVGPGYVSLDVSETVLNGKVVTYNTGTGKYDFTNILIPGIGYWLNPKPTISCNDPTPHYATGCELLLHYDADNDGVINLTELTQSLSDSEGGVITEDEYDFVSDCYIVHEGADRTGRINAFCPGCYGAVTKTVTFNSDPSGANVTVIE